ncbi:hypothetical protein IE991_26935 [Klebsiella pneumoniae]|uniref:Uncharacterized protein n=1 Tax=Klebsiella pneumoniae TaxID=573 RepID=A0A927D963_KLEPN|nr:hypothetical protein [Klebsiella pneumoniae]MBD3701465.1 hypothetical protein [Klebsiella pneumoniae]
MALRLPNLHYPHAHASAAPPGDCRGHGAAFYAGRRLTPCPAYGAIARLFCRAAADALPGLRGPDPVCESPPNMGPLKLPGLAASTSLRRSRKAGAARMDAG